MSDGKTQYRETRGFVRTRIQHIAGSEIIKRVNGFHLKKCSGAL
jgi:hypothetical protein